MKQLKLLLKSKGICLPERPLKRLEKLFLSFWFLILVIIPIILLFLPADYFDEGQSICLSVLLANTECFGCGMTRAIMHLIHFEFDSAWSFNKISFIVLPLTVFVLISELIKYLKSLNGIESKNKK